jgi:putative ABC transport system permease protein
MAFRNVFRQKRRSLFTGLSIVGGYALAVIFIGWADGSYNSIIDQFTRNRLGQVQIHARNYLDRPSLSKTIDDLPRLGAILDDTPGVESWAPRVYASGLAALGNETAGVEIIGLDPKREEATTRFEREIVRGRDFSGPEAKETLLGRELAEILGARLGDRIVLISQGADGSLANDLFTLVGIISTGDPLGDQTSFYLPLAAAQDFLVLGNRVQEIAITVRRIGRARAMAATIARRIGEPGLAVDPWQVFARSFYVAMKADKSGMWVLLVVIVVIVAVGVLNTVLMAVLERRREYGLLKALGTRPGRVVSLVLAEVLILACLSLVLGAGLGLGANLFLSHHGIKFSSGLTWGGMVFDTMRSEVNLRSFIIPAVTVLVCALIVGLVPAWKAARTEPARAMRQH